MLKRLRDFFKGLTPVQQLIIAFVFNWLLWLISFLLKDKLFSEQHTWVEYTFDASFMGLFMTIVNNFTLVRRLFQRKQGG